MKIKAADIVISAMLAAIMLVCQVVLAFLPNIEVVSILVIVGTLVFERRMLISIYVFALLEGLIYGFGIWWINYLYVWTILYVITRLFKKNSSVIFWMIVSALFGLFFGMLCSIPYAIAGGVAAGIANWVAGIMFDITHCVGNLIVALVLFKPLLRVMTYVKKLYVK